MGSHLSGWLPWVLLWARVLHSVVAASPERALRSSLLSAARCAAWAPRLLAPNFCLESQAPPALAMLLSGEAKRPTCGP